MDEELDEETLLIKTIKGMNRYQKSQQSYEHNINENDNKKEDYKQSAFFNTMKDLSKQK